MFGCVTRESAPARFLGNIYWAIGSKILQHILGDRVPLTTDTGGGYEDPTPLLLRLFSELLGE